MVIQKFFQAHYFNLVQTQDLLGKLIEKFRFENSFYSFSCVSYFRSYIKHTKHLCLK